MQRKATTKGHATRYLEIITGIFVAVVIVSNIASTKILLLGPFTFDGGTLLFPISYIFGDILTEVYGYKASRRVIWTGFLSCIMMSFVLWIVGTLPSAGDWPHQEAYRNILMYTPRIAIASLIAFSAGEFSNSYILAKMKIRMKGRFLWMRTIGSTLVGEGVDTAIFCVIAFAGMLPNSLLAAIIISNYIFKVGVEVLATPATYKAVAFLKKREELDVYDTETKFNPFSMQI
ncbi:transporter [candidate division LCP-89 bacterium B3_LCP]|uniref:Probable queuosine precursor transporter n=1 Tax=candidate division LCP-89 bacterium B3_LCP TaxID=2012998 RepID=A0A532V052_UNCL8|nr:MAG: transporter [candidate division LCP-89 bacterium B3_LCP]